MALPEHQDAYATGANSDPENSALYFITSVKMELRH
jgi:hypothetical protein